MMDWTADDQPIWLKDSAGPYPVDALSQLLLRACRQVLYREANPLPRRRGQVRQLGRLVKHW